MKCWNIPQNFLCVFPFYMKTQHLCAQTWLTINLHCVPVIGWVHLCSHFQPNALAKKRSLLTSIYTSGTCYQKVKRCLLLTLAQETLRCINACTSEAVEQVIPVSQEQFWLPSTMVFAVLYIPTCTELVQMSAKSRHFQIAITPIRTKMRLYSDDDQRRLSQQPRKRLQLVCPFSTRAKPSTFGEFLHSGNKRVPAKVWGVTIFAGMQAQIREQMASCFASVHN